MPKSDCNMLFNFINGNRHASTTGSSLHLQTTRDGL